MTLKCTALTAAAAAAVAAGLAVPTSASAAEDPANVSDYLSRQLGSLSGQTTVMVHGTTLAAARDAVAAAGLDRTGAFEQIGVVIATGDRAEIQAVRTEPGVTYVEGGEQPIRFFQETSNKATRGIEAAQTLTGADGAPLDGRGVSVGVIDSGVDPTHPYFKEADGSSAVVANLKALCEPLTETCSVQRLPNSVDTDTLSVGGHGTHVKDRKSVV